VGVWSNAAATQALLRKLIEQMGKQDNEIRAFMAEARRRAA
jgi:hypothetical protein